MTLIYIGAIPIAGKTAFILKWNPGDFGDHWQDNYGFFLGTGSPFGEIASQEIRQTEGQ